MLGDNSIALVSDGAKESVSQNGFLFVDHSVTLLNIKLETNLALVIS